MRPRREFARALKQVTFRNRNYGVRPSRAFEQAAAEFVLENQHKRNLTTDLVNLKHLMPWIGAVALDHIHIGTLQPWVQKLRKEGMSPRHDQSWAQDRAPHSQARGNRLVR